MARIARFTLGLIPVAGLGMLSWTLYAQATVQPVNDLPTPYRLVENFFQLPAGREWGATSAVEVDRDGRSIWVAERCGGNSSCLANNVDPVLKFDANGKLVTSFGRGMIIAPHGIHVDRDGNIWVTDYQDDVTGGRAPVGGTPPGGAARGRGDGAGRGADAARGRGDGAGRGDAAARGAARGDAAGGQAGRGAAVPQPIPRPGATKGHQVFKFSPEGKVLMTIGKPGGAAAPDCCWQPNDVITSPSGDIFVAMSHGSGGTIMKFTKDGKFVKSWGGQGNAPGQFNTPHSLAFDSRGRLFVADRGNVRLQIFDQDGKFLEETKAFSRLSGIYIDRNDVLYGADSESSATSNPGWLRGIRIGSAKDLKPMYFIPDPAGPGAASGGTSAAEGVAADVQGNVYGAEVGPTDVKRYVKR
jgi:sugar lactone lactonase YvrE